MSPIDHAPPPFRRLRRARPHAVVLAGVSLLFVAACSSPPATSPSASPSAAASPSAPAPSEPASPSASASPSESAAAVQTYEVIGKDFTFELPSPNLPAGPTEIVLKNEGAEPHQAQLARIVDGKTFADLTVALQAADPAAALGLVSLAGGPTNVDPGASVSTTTNLTPGSYAFLCFFAGDDGIPHIAKGMVSSVTVEEPASTAEVPVGDVEVTASDFTYQVPNPVPADTASITFVNDGPQPHEASIFRLAEGVTIDDIKAMMSSTEPPTGPPPITNAGGIGGIGANETALIDVDLEPGEYALICFIPDPASGKSHAELGMIVGMTVAQ